ncbi:MAG: hypothetical protein DRP93_07240, partial [Candidatus Neomarinimicrobiota bacterium]
SKDLYSPRKKSALTAHIFNHLPCPLPPSGGVKGAECTFHAMYIKGGGGEVGKSNFNGRVSQHRLHPLL